MGKSGQTERGIHPALRRRGERALWALLAAWLLCLCACSAPAPSEAEQTPPPDAGESAASAPAMPPEDALAVRISEVMPHNSATLRDEDGDFPDWIELENIADHPVDLAGWILSDKGIYGWTFPQRIIQPGERLIVFASGKDRHGETLHTSFSLSDGESVSLFDAAGTLSDQLTELPAATDVSAYRDGEGTTAFTGYPTPGFENSTAGYDARQDALSVPAGLFISEAMVSNELYPVGETQEYCDWVELKNGSDGPLRLSDYYLSDKASELRRCRLPDLELAAGESVVLRCSGETGEDCVSFKLSTEGESLYLSDAAGLVDFLSLGGIPHNCSAGRMSGRNGVFLFSRPTPGQENRDGCRRVSALPVSLTPPGVYDGVESVSVELAPSDAVIRYTLDGSAPDESSEIYRGPVTLSSTGIFRAVAEEDGCLASGVLTLNYIVNENHTLPVLCICGNGAGELSEMVFKKAVRDAELPGNISFYEENGSFSMDCGISLSGAQGSLSLPKKSFKIHFRGKYGGSVLDYDLFGQKVKEFSSLTVRSGQNAYELVFKNELWQGLLVEMNEDALSMYSRFCVLYIDGEYAGVYSLKEDLSREYYASHAGVDPDSVEVQRFPVDRGSAFYTEMIEWFRETDLSDDANYARFCEMVDIDSLIDWFIIEGESANVDLFANVRLFRSPENGNRWAFAFFDVDLTKDSYTAPFSVLFGHSEMLSEHMSAIVWAVCRNQQFVDRLLTRYAEVYHTLFSNENLLSRIDAYQALLEPEMQRDAELWHGGSTQYWYNSLALYRRIISEYDWEHCCVDHLLYWLDMFHCLDAPREEVRARYFH